MSGCPQGKSQRGICLSFEVFCNLVIGISFYSSAKQVLKDCSTTSTGQKASYVPLWMPTLPSLLELGSLHIATLRTGGWEAPCERFPMLPGRAHVCVEQADDGKSLTFGPQGEVQHVTKRVNATSRLFLRGVRSYHGQHPPACA